MLEYHLYLALSFFLLVRFLIRLMPDLTHVCTNSLFVFQERITYCDRRRQCHWPPPRRNRVPPDPLPPNSPQGPRDRDVISIRPHANELEFLFLAHILGKQL